MRTTTMHTAWMVTMNPTNGSTGLFVTQEAVCRAGSHRELEGGMRRRVMTMIMTYPESTLTSGETSELCTDAT